MTPASAEQFEELGRGGGGGCRVLARDQSPVDEDKTLPVGGLLIEAAQASQLVFDEERNELRELNCVLLLSRPWRCI